MAESDRTQQAIIFVNGDCDTKTLSTLELSNESLLIAVDGGLRHVKALNRVPDYLIGDMDSVDSVDLKALTANQHTTVISHQPEKDSTDLELTLAFAATLRISTVILVGISGGRLDHTLANLLLLGVRDWPYAIDVVSAEGQASLLTPQRSFKRALQPGSELSLLPLSFDVAGVSTEGLYYQLQNARIHFGSSLGISNQVNAETTSVSIKQGKLLLVIPS